MRIQRGYIVPCPFKLIINYVICDINIATLGRDIGKLNMLVEKCEEWAHHMCRYTPDNLWFSSLIPVGYLLCGRTWQRTRLMEDISSTCWPVLSQFLL